MEKKYSQIGSQVPTEFKQQFKNFCTENGFNQSKLIRKLIEDFMKKHSKK